jgi:hypothetical protein
MGLITASGAHHELSFASYLWIDQMCINQASTKEKNHQVQRMADAFSQAELVIVWLGPGNEHSDLVMTTLASVEKDAPFAGKTQAKPSRSEKEAVDFFFHQPYWKAIWIVQEVLLAQTLIVCFGQRFVPWDVLHDLISVRQVLDLFKTLEFPGESLVSRAVTDLLSKRDSMASKQHKRFEDWDSLHQALKCFSSETECENPLDKIYGLLAIVRTTDQHGHRLPPAC